MKTKTIIVRVYEVGDRLKYGKKTYLLAYLGDNRVVLIDAKTGFMWDEPIEVEDHNAITDEELELVMDNSDFFSNFEYLGNNIG